MGLGNVKLWKLITYKKIRRQLLPPMGLRVQLPGFLSRPGCWGSKLAVHLATEVAHLGRMSHSGCTSVVQGVTPWKHQPLSFLFPLVLGVGLPATCSLPLRCSRLGKGVLATYRVWSFLRRSRATNGYAPKAAKELLQQRRIWEGRHLNWHPRSAWGQGRSQLRSVLGLTSASPGNRA